MTNYKNIFGKPVKFLATDPDNAEAEGQIWYNSTSESFKSVVVGEAWSSASNMITARYAGAGAGIQTANFLAGGFSTTNTTNTEEYNGLGWETGGAIPTATRENAGAGTLTAGLIFGGNPPTSALEYDGSAWTAGGSLNTARQSLAGAGTQTAGLGFAGYDVADSAATESYNGSTWTTLPGTLNNSRYSLAGFGIQTAALAVAGLDSPARTNVTEEWNGSIWTAGGTYPASVSGIKGAGTVSAGLAFGGSTSPPTILTTTASYDGSTWTSKPNMAVAKSNSSYAGTTSAAIAGGGIQTAPGTNGSATEEFNRSATVITGAAWSSGGNLPVGKQGFGGAGTRSASLIFGGYIGGPGVTGYVATTEEYNGASWSSGGALPTSRSNPIGFGTQTAGVAFGGIDNVPVFLSSGDHYDGSTWTATPNNYPSNVTNASSCGTQTAGLAANGYDGTAYLNNSNEYDGTSWTAGGTVPVSWSGRGTGGIQTSAIIFGGTDGGSPFPASGQSQSDEYNGSTWTTVASLPSGRIYPSGAGNTSADNVRAMGGRLASPAGTPTAEHNIYDGTVWSTQPSITTARQQAGITVYSSTPEAMITGGNDPGGSFLTATEEFTGETTALNLKTLTTS